MVVGYEPLIPSIDLPDVDDRHVVAAAIAGAARTIVTWNVRDFPRSTMGLYEIEVQTPDEFLTVLVETARPTIWSCIRQIADARTSRPHTPYDILKQLEHDGLRAFVSALVPDRR